MQNNAMRKTRRKLGGQSSFTSDQKKLVEELSKTDFFSTFTFEEIALLMFCAENIKCETDEMIFREGDVGHQFFAIRKGKVKIRKEKSGTILATLGPGEVFGEMAVLDNQPRSASAISVKSSELFAFDGHRLLDDFPHLSVKLLRYLARELSRRLREADMLIDKF
ncbi:MAG: cyclic nucleotide-binding domain-containing protein [Candidatus Glassbacteria bacterium]|nr:cyclic nucleotide-binding domain-containing protein [Candidatus Glassbacteria bacterium]